MASKWGNYTITEFQEQDTEIQACVIAAYRVQNQLEAVMQEDSMKKNKSAKVASKGRGKRR